MKRLCAKAALDLVPDHGIIGLGGGETISYLAEDIKEADVVILAVDIAITGTERFEGKPTIKVPTNVCVKAPKKLIEKIENELGK